MHGSSADASNNIAQGGFNRSLNGRNTTSYDRGTYFAKTGNFAYSSQPQYATPDERGLQRLSLSQVIPGETLLACKDELCDAKEPPSYQENILQGSRPLWQVWVP